MRTGPKRGNPARNVTCCGLARLARCGERACDFVQSGRYQRRAVFSNHWNGMEVDVDWKTGEVKDRGARARGPEGAARLDSGGIGSIVLEMRPAGLRVGRLGVSDRKNAKQVALFDPFGNCVGRDSLGRTEQPELASASTAGRPHGTRRKQSARVALDMVVAQKNCSAILFRRRLRILIVFLYKLR